MLAMDALRALETNSKEQSRRGTHFAFVDGSVKAMCANYRRPMLSSVMPAGPDELYHGDDWPEDLVAAIPSRQLRQPRDTKEVIGTEINVLRSSPFTSDSNRLWCASLQMAWASLKLELGGDIVPVVATPGIQAMNAELLRGTVISPQALFQGISNGSPTSDAALQRSLDQRFPDIKYRLQQSSGKPTLRVVAAIRKQMPFEEEFERLKDGLSFRNTAQSFTVENFGYEPATQGFGPVFEDQLQIVDDKSDDNFTVRLQTIGPQKDQIFLAMIPSKGTLGAT